MTSLPDVEAEVEVRFFDPEVGSGSGIFWPGSRKSEAEVRFFGPEVGSGSRKWPFCGRHPDVFRMSDWAKVSLHFEFWTFISPKILIFCSKIAKISPVSLILALNCPLLAQKSRKNFFLIFLIIFLVIQ
jgi:hypothetical protein